MKYKDKLKSIVFAGAIFASLIAPTFASSLPRTDLIPKRDNIYVSNIKQWQKPDSIESKINQASIERADRVVGHTINPLANKDAKITNLSTMNAKSADTSSVGSHTFTAYAFDYWQYLDSMVFWDGVVPTPDVIDAAHRNGSPIYGTLFFNWSRSAADQEVVRYFLEEDSLGSKTYESARKLVDIANYYGFDGYFINQETSMYPDAKPKYSEDFRDLMIYANDYSMEKYGRKITFAWYDAMLNNGYNQNKNKLDETNDIFFRPREDGKIPAEENFLNFNWGADYINQSISRAKEVGRNPFDVYAGLELQKGGSYKTRVNREAITDENGRARISIGLYEASTILGQDPEKYHEEENKFWTGFSGDPSKEDDSNAWSGMARFVADKTPITSLPFNTYFNTGHGKQWFIDGKVSLKTEWNHRSVQDIMPTWRWWVKASGANRLNAGYDFNDAYNSGNSIEFTGILPEGESNEFMLYNTSAKASASTKLKVTYKANSKAAIGITTDSTYENDYSYYGLTNTNNEWVTEIFDLNALAGKNIEAISIKFDGGGSDIKFNLGGLALADDFNAPAAPTNFKVLESIVHTGKTAEATVNFDRVADVDYYEVYQNIDGEYKLVTASSSNYVYLSNLMRGENNTGTQQELRVVAVGKNGVKSEPTQTNLDWQIRTTDAEELPADPENVVLGAKVTKATNESAAALLTGTITSLTDKWWNDGKRGYVEIELTEPRTVRRWVVEHAGAGGESVGDGKMNARDFDLYYKVNPQDPWKLLQSVRGNKAHVTDLSFDNDVAAKYYKFDVLYGDNDTPWTGIRIYNWKMYEEKLNPVTDPVPMAYAKAIAKDNGRYDLVFAEVEENTTVKIYTDQDEDSLIAEKKNETKGPLTIENLELPGQNGVVYYKSVKGDFAPSVRFAIVYENEKREISDVKIKNLPKKTGYILGEDLDLRGGTLLISYVDGNEEEIPMTNISVKVIGDIDKNTQGEKKIKLSYLDEEAKGDFTVSYVDSSSLLVEKIELQDLPDKAYFLNEKFNAKKATLKVTYTNGFERIIPITDLDVKISGFDSTTIGNKTLTISYMGKVVEFDYLVEKQAINYQRLEQTLNEVAILKASEGYKEAPDEDREALEKVEKEAREFLEKGTEIQDEVDNMVIKLNEAIKVITNPVLDYSKLDSVIDEAYDFYNSSDWPTLPLEMRQNFVSTYNTAYGILANEAAKNQKEVDKHVALLRKVLDDINEFLGKDVKEEIDYSKLDETMGLAVETRQREDWENAPVELRDAFRAAFNAAVPVINGETAESQKQVDNLNSNLLKAINDLVTYLDNFEIDYSKLGEAMDRAVAARQNPDWDKLPQDIRDAFRQAFNQAVPVMNEKSAKTQKQIDDLTKNLEEQIESLTKAYDALPKADKTKLEKAILQAESRKLTSYSKQSADNLKSTLAKAKEVYTDKNASQDEVNRAQSNLIKAIFKLERPKAADKTILNEVIKGAENKLQTIEKSSYTESSIKAYQEAINNAKVVSAKATSSQEEVNKAVSDLNRAETQLELKEKVDKTKLNNLLSRASKYKTSKYTDKDSVDRFNKALEKAKEVLANKDASKEEVNNAYSTLLRAMFGLK